MRWLVEVSSSAGKTDLQKYCVEAESWQRALQAARAQRGEEGPMSGFSIELLEEGYRAVDPVSRIRFVVKRAPDDMPITTPASKGDGAKGVPPSPPSVAPPPASSAAVAPSSTPAKKSIPPRPGDKAPSIPPSKKLSLPSEAKDASKKPSIKPPAVSQPSQPPPAIIEEIPQAPLLPVGSLIPGLPQVKLLSSREQDPTDASPLTYREYSFSVAPGTSEEVATNILKGQLRLVDAHIAKAKMGKLVNLAVFDVEFTGKPPAPPIATLTWKDWKGDPVIGYPRRGAGAKQVKPPSASGTQPAVSAPMSERAPNSALFPPPSVMPQGATPRPLEPETVPNPFSSTAPLISPAMLPQNQPAALKASQPPPPISASQPPPPPISASQPPPALATAPITTFQPASVPPPQSVPPPAIMQAPAITDVSPASELPRRPSSPDGMVRTPSGRFVRGRTTGDELITSLFESMHDLHFLRDALDGGQFCLALATEVLPAKVALIHFFDVEKREWVIACTRGKDTGRMLTMRTPESDELLRDAARKRRAIVPEASAAIAQRYQTLGGSKSLIIAPIMQAGRALGAIEIINPLDGMPFTEDEGNAMTYIAEQYAEYLGSRGIVLDRDRIQNAAQGPR